MLGAVNFETQRLDYKTTRDLLGPFGERLLFTFHFSVPEAQDMQGKTVALPSPHVFAISLITDLVIISL